MSLAGKRGRVIRATAIAGSALVAAVLVLLLVSADARFLGRATFEEARILLRRRSLDRLIADPATSDERRAAFELVRAARQFAVDSLGLRARGTFATYADVGRDTLVLVISASPRDALSDYRWHYPIVGAVPYKGFFDFAAAASEAKDLEARGYDTYTRPSPAFSTLGWFDDPLLSTALTRDRVVLVATILHELTHNTWYVPSQTPFDESLAEFVGWRGAQCFFRARQDSVSANRAAAIWRDEKRLGRFYERLSVSLGTLYGRHLSGAALDSGRAAVFGAASQELAGGLDGTLEVYRGGRWALNNATVVAQLIYHTQLGVFDDALRRNAESLGATLAEVGPAIRGDAGRRDPFAAVTRIQAHATSGTCGIPSPI
ncbi:MAG TPA: aminopeptidase [Gemmatimonadales bacterium]